MWLSLTVEFLANTELPVLPTEGGLDVIFMYTITHNHWSMHSRKKHQTHQALFRTDTVGMLHTT